MSICNYNNMNETNFEIKSKAVKLNNLENEVHLMFRKITRNISCLMSLIALYFVFNLSVLTAEANIWYETFLWSIPLATFFIISTIMYFCKCNKNKTEILKLNNEINGK